ncbi:MAG TPA: hypothetical protein VMM76_05665 [Pirellulaceae bacterium]|nr:hypothetical protein [Pirellulaceae bacterium]
MVGEPVDEVGEGFCGEAGESFDGGGDAVELGGHRVVARIGKLVQGRGELLEDVFQFARIVGVAPGTPVEFGGEHGFVVDVVEGGDCFPFGFLEVGPAEEDQRSECHTEFAASDRGVGTYSVEHLPDRIVGRHFSHVDYSSPAKALRRMDFLK